MRWVQDGSDWELYRGVHLVACLWWMRDNTWFVECINGNTSRCKQLWLAKKRAEAMA